MNYVVYVGPYKRAGMGGRGSGRKTTAVARKVTLASLAAVVEAQRAEIASLRASVEILLSRGGGDRDREGCRLEFDAGDGVGCERVAANGTAVPVRAGNGKAPAAEPTQPSPPGPPLPASASTQVLMGGPTEGILGKLLFVSSEKASGARRSAEGFGPEPTSSRVVRNVRRKTSASFPTTLDTLPRDVLHALASGLSAGDLGSLMSCSKGLRDGLRGAAPAEIVFHGSDSASAPWGTPPPRSSDILWAQPTTKIGRACRALRNGGAAKHLRRLRVFLWENFSTEAPEVEALIRECAALETFELSMPGIGSRSHQFVDLVFMWTGRIFDILPSDLTTLEIPIAPAMLNGSCLARFTKLEYLTVATYAPLPGSVSRPSNSPFRLLIETVLSQLPRLRSLVARGNANNPLPIDISLISESLESFIVRHDKEVTVTNFRCPKLRTFQLSSVPSHGESESMWKALETGAHALDLETVPADCRRDFHQQGFVDGVFSFDHDGNFDFSHGSEL